MDPAKNFIVAKCERPDHPNGYCIRAASRPGMFWHGTKRECDEVLEVLQVGIEETVKLMRS